MKKLLKTCSLFALSFFLIIGGCQSKSNLEIAQTSLEIGDFIRARQLFNQILNVEPDNTLARYGLALSWYRESSNLEIEAEQKYAYLKNAHKEFSILAKTDTSINVNNWHSQALYQLAKLKLAKDPDLAVQLINQSLEKDPENIFSLNLKAIIFKELGNQKLASSLWNEITEIDPTFENAWIELGLYYYDNNDFQNAYITWQLGLEQNPKNAQLKQWLLKVTTLLGL